MINLVLVFRELISCSRHPKATAFPTRKINKPLFLKPAHLPALWPRGGGADSDIFPLPPALKIFTLGTDMQEHAITIDRPMVLIPVEEYRELLAEAGYLKTPKDR